MGAVAGLDFLLSKPARRRRKELAHFFESLGLYLEAGLDIGYAWPQTLAALRDELGAVASLLALPDGESITALLGRLGREYPQTEHALWFSVLAELYERGAGLREGVQAAARTLREEHQRALEAHCQRLPMRTNVLMLLFFLPPTLLLLFAPLLYELSSS